MPLSVKGKYRVSLRPRIYSWHNYYRLKLYEIEETTQHRSLSPTEDRRIEEDSRLKRVHMDVFCSRDRVKPRITSVLTHKSHSKSKWSPQIWMIRIHMVQFSSLTAREFMVRKHSAELPTSQVTRKEEGIMKSLSSQCLTSLMRGKSRWNHRKSSRDITDSGIMTKIESQMRSRCNLSRSITEREGQLLSSSIVQKNLKGDLFQIEFTARAMRPLHRMMQPKRTLPTAFALKLGDSSV